MSGSRNGGTPLYRRVTARAEGSACIAVLCTGRFLVGKSYRSMYMRCSVCDEVILIHISHAGVHFCINMELFIGEGACGSVNMSNKTHINVHLHILCPEGVTGPVSLSCITGSLNIGIKVKNTHGKLGENCCAGIVVDTGTGNRNRCCVGFLCNGIGCSEAFCKLHVIELPMVNIV